MRRRLVAAFLALTVLTLLLFGIPRAFIVAERTREAEQRDLTRIARTALALVDAEAAQDRAVDTSALANLIGPEDALEVRGSDPADVVTVGRPLAATTGLSSTAAGAGAEVSVARSTTAVRLQVLESLTSIALIGLAVAAIAVVLAFLLARALSQPFVALAREAERLGDGHFDLDLPSTRLPEARAIREALTQSAARLQDTLRREREFAANASHQLRTPLTGLRLRLEDLTLWPMTPEDVRTELTAGIADVDRLAETVTGMLELSRRGRYGTLDQVDLADRAEDAVGRWQGPAGVAGRTVRLGHLDPAIVYAPVGAIDEVVDVLVHNAIHHGRGAVTVETLADQATLRLRVRDEGDGVPTAERARIFERHERGDTSDGAGIGLPLARDVAHSLGGRLIVGSGAPTTFDLILPTD